MDLSLLTALTYAEFANQDYAAVVSGVKQIHGHKHEGAAVVHYFAAAAMEAQGNFAGARGEMETALAEAPKSESVGEWRKMLQQIKDEEAGRLISAARGDAHAGSMRLVDQPAKVDVAFHGPTAAETFQRVQQTIQDKKEEGEI